MSFCKDKLLMMVMIIMMKMIMKMKMMMLLLREADWAMGGAALGLLAALVEMVVGKVGNIIISIVISSIIVISVSINIVIGVSINIVISSSSSSIESLTALVEMFVGKVGISDINNDINISITIGINPMSSKTCSLNSVQPQTETSAGESPLITICAGCREQKSGESEHAEETGRLGRRWGGEQADGGGGK